MSNIGDVKVLKIGEHYIYQLRIYSDVVESARSYKTAKIAKTAGNRLKKNIGGSND